MDGGLGFVSGLNLVEILAMEWEIGSLCPERSVVRVETDRPFAEEKARKDEGGRPIGSCQREWTERCWLSADFDNSE